MGSYIELVRGAASCVHTRRDTPLKRATSRNFPYFLQVRETLLNRGYTYENNGDAYRLWEVGNSLKLYDFFHPKREQSLNLFLDAALYELKSILLTLNGVFMPGGKVHTYQVFKAFSIKHSIKSSKPLTTSDDGFKYECWKFRFLDQHACNNFLAVCEAYGNYGIEAAKTKASEFEQIEPLKTAKSVITESRIGQSKFRKDLLRYWKTCSVTGLSVEVLLRASHIKPWSAASPAERLDSFNGLLLSPNLDALFDAGLISFNVEGVLLISSRIEQNQHSALGISAGMKLTRINGAHSPYLAYHRENIFKP